MVKKSLDEIIQKLEDLRLQTEQTLAEFKAASRAAEDQVPQPRRSHGVFRAGDRVLITNRINHTLRGVPGSGTDQIGIVQRVTAERVHFVTLAGTHTCRAPKNLRLLEAYRGPSSGDT
jgi:hypothetical protein